MTPPTVVGPAHREAGEAVRRAVAFLHYALEQLEEANQEESPQLTPDDHLLHQISLVADLATVNAALLVLTQTPLSKSG